MADIQNLTERSTLKYVESVNNRADDITFGKTLRDLSEPHRWHNAPDFLYQTKEYWPTSPSFHPASDVLEQRKFAFCGHVTVDNRQQLPDGQFSTWKELMQAELIASFPSR